MSVDPMPVLIGFLACATYTDLRYREIPNALILIGAGAGMLGSFVGLWTWHWGWMVAGVVPLLISAIPAGDCKAVMVVGGFLGEPVAIIVLASLCLMWALWFAYGRGWIAYPGTMPFSPLLTGFTCGIVVARVTGGS